MKGQGEDAKPLITIIVPVYQTEKYLSRCVDSILAQTYENLEILLIDDASTDASGRICDTYAKQDKRIQSVHHTENRGVSSARNTGLDMAKGDYICFIDSDDYIEKDMVDGLYQNLQKERADVCVSALDRVGNEKYADSWQDSPACLVSGTQAIYRMIRRQAFSWNLGGKLFTKHLLEMCRFEEKIYYGEDILYLYCVFKRVQKVCYIPAPWYHYIYREGSAMHSKFSMKQYTQFYAYEILYHDAAKNYPELLPRIEQKILDINIRLAVNAVDCKDIRERKLYGYLRKFRENIRRYTTKEALALLEYKKIMLEVILLYSSVEIFWLVLIFYKGMKGFLKRWFR